MPRKFGLKRKRPGVMRRRFIGRVGGRRKFLYYKKSPKGKIMIMRKLPEISVSNSGVLGGVNLTTATVLPVSCLAIGTPTQSVGAVGTSSYDIPFSMKFTLNQLINHTDITNLTDKYRIAGVYVRVYYNKTGSSTLSTGSYPCLQYITDHDDAIVPTISQLREKMGVKFKTFNNSSSYIGIKVRPVPSREVYNTGITTGYEVPKYAPYLDCATDSIEHYGIKGVISNFSLPTTQGIELLKWDVAVRVVAKDIQ